MKELKTEFQPTTTRASDEWAGGSALGQSSERKPWDKRKTSTTSQPITTRTSDLWAGGSALRQREPR